MPAYWVARAKITDPVQYKKYTDLVPAIIAKHGKRTPACVRQCKVIHVEP